MAYATVADVKAYLKGVELDVLGTSAEQDAALAQATEVAGDHVERRANRSFTPVSETRVFDGSGTERLVIPDLLALAGWEVDGVGRDGTELRRYPLWGLPTLWLVLREGVFPKGRANVAVTGIWGYAMTPPAAVAQATALYAACDVLARAGGGEGRRDDGGHAGVAVAAVRAGGVRLRGGAVSPGRRPHPDDVPPPHARLNAPRRRRRRRPA